MSFVYTVQPGDHMAKIADEHGFSDYRTIWDLPSNTALRDKRPDPSLLMPGDQVVIPDVQHKKVPVATGSEHKFKLKGQRLRLRLLVCDFLGMPQKHTDCQLTVDGASAAAHTDRDGFIDVALRPCAEQAKLVVGPFEYEIRIGHLDPPEERSGGLARLRNLGYITIASDADIDEDALRFAVQRFQRDHHLPIDGQLASITAKLKEVHGS